MNKIFTLLLVGALTAGAVTCLLYTSESLIILQRQMKTYVYRSIKKSAYQIR